MSGPLVLRPGLRRTHRRRTGRHNGKVAKTSIDKQFQNQVHDMVNPGTSALFLMREKVTPDMAVEATVD